MELCDHCTALDASETPRWPEFLATQLLWPAVTHLDASVFRPFQALFKRQVLLTLSFLGLSLVYKSLSRRRASVRIFLQRYVGTPDRLKARRSDRSVRAI